MRHRATRIQAILAGTITGVIAAGGIAIALLALSVGPSSPAMALSAAPAVLAIATLVALPTAALMVWCLTEAARAVPLFDSLVAWVLAGILFASPTALLFSYGQPGADQFALASPWSFFLAVGALSAFAAWLWRREPLRDAPGLSEPAAPPYSPPDGAA
ncbi:hypothetical protein HNP52_000615 [Sphingomonas kyeonggiensis]|uniref:Uncharacterized protein n=1 Tax=Sphingomonas kyeonggiensis TaxID=1268553 RepID=A0A7W7JYF8_9SPHN|nr:hypothetical protein [Sphingomonas kyeonggiensis]MBB4837564.1 hypothetical protein [Sphingomonas kyeonggiensis]